MSLGENPLAEDFVNWADWVRDRVEPKLAKVFPADAKGQPTCCLLLGPHHDVPKPGLPRRDPLALTPSGSPTAPGGRHGSRSTAGPARSTCTSEPGHATAERRSVRRHSEGQFSHVSRLRYLDGSQRTSGSMGRSIGFGRRLYAVLDIDGRIRTYRAPTAEEIEGADAWPSALLDELEETPDGTSPAARRTDGEIAVPPLWQPCLRHRHLPRTLQRPSAVRPRVASARLCGPLMIRCWPKGMQPDRAAAVATYLGLCVDRIADYDSSFCVLGYVTASWSAQHVSRGRRSQWSGTTSRSTRSRTSRAVGTVRSGGSNSQFGTAQRPAPSRRLFSRGDAQQLAFQDGTFDAVIVDPPYYDAIQYGDLSDFFYVWLKRSIGHLYPGVFGRR